MSGGPISEEAETAIRERVREMIVAGARMITIVAREDDHGIFELIYVFDQDGRMVNFRFPATPELEIDSVADIYKGAVNMEREIVDLFGLRFKGVRGGLFLEIGKSPVTPLRRKTDKGGQVDG